MALSTAHHLFFMLVPIAKSAITECGLMSFQFYTQKIHVQLVHIIDKYYQTHSSENYTKKMTTVSQDLNLTGLAI